jgi:hypothetical protein
MHLPVGDVTLGRQNVQCLAMIEKSHKQGKLGEQGSSWFKCSALPPRTAHMLVNWRHMQAPGQVLIFPFLSHVQLE